MRSPIQCTYFGANSWLLELANLRVLIDPWLVDSLVFGGQRWLFEAVHRNNWAIPERIDLILLSQGLPDHAHVPTLEQLDRTIPVVGSVNAAKVVEKLGYSDITPLQPGEIHTLKKRLEIRALPGAPVPKVENGYLLTRLKDECKLYYEPHGFAPADVGNYAPVDGVISPVVNLELPLLGPFVKGQETAFELAKTLQPTFLLQTTAGGNIEYRGLLNSILKAKGSIEELQQRLRDEGSTTQILSLEPGQPCKLRFPSPSEEGSLSNALPWFAKVKALWKTRLKPIASS